ncbi:MAG: hypothetical protein DI539_06575 [Flavobacterium psychrophilum]|nr:MAG: hypothetical protein DI539_06575 [Flavobacterium psychrophilum]
MNTPFFVLFYLTLFIGSPLIIFLHELGHSLIALLFTKKEVQMFIGSYGKTDQNYRIKIGSLYIYIEKNVSDWRKGMCAHSPHSKESLEILQIIAGPLLPFIVALLFLTTAVLYLSENMIVSSVFFLLFSSFSMVYNLIPNKKATDLNNGELLYNDGQLLMNVLKHKKINAKYILAINIYNQQKYAEAIIMFDKFLKDGFDSQITYRFLISSQLQLRNYGEARKLVEESIAKHEQDSNDYINAGLGYSHLELEDEALSMYEKSLAINRSWHALNNIGYSLNLKAQYSEALTYFDEALSLDSHAYTYNNRGLAKIKLGDIEGGLKDLEQGHKLDPENSYYYKNMGIYHFDRCEYQKALEYFEKAKEMDPTTHHIDKEIETAKIKLRIA